MQRAYKYSILVTGMLLWSVLLLGQEKAEKPFEDAAVLKTSFLTIRNVNITGNKITKKYIIEREIPLKKGSTYSISDILSNLQLSRQNLMNTALFVDVTVDFTNWVNDSLDVIADVKERWYYFPIPYFKPVDRNLNVWIKEYGASLERVNYGIKFAGNNVSGRNDKVNFFLISGYSRQIALSYAQPFADKQLKKGFFFNVAYTKNHEINYTTEFNKQQFYKNDEIFMREQFHADVGFTYRQASIARHSIRVGYTAERVADTVLKLNPVYFNDNKTNVKFMDLSYTYQYLGVDYIPYPLKGFTWDLTVLARPFEKDVQLYVLSAHVSKYWTLGRKNYLGLQGVGTIKFPFDQPYYNQRLFGNSDAYVRGLEYYVIDGSAGAIVKATYRREILSVRLKTGLKSRSYAVIPFKFYAKAYSDAAYAYKSEAGSNTLNNTFIYTYGVGLDMLTIYDFSIRLEFSLNQFHEKGLFLHTRSDF